MNLAASIEEAVRQFPELPAIADGTISLSYREFHARAMALVHFFKREGIRPGDRMAIRLPNVTDVMTLAYATWWAGAVFVPLNTRFSAVDLAEIVKDVEPRYLVLPEHDKQLLPLTQLPGFTTVLWAEQSSDTPQHLNHIVAQNREPSLWEPMEPRKDTDPALIMYTSGTTGRPKGVIQTHRNNTAAIQMLGNTWQVTRHDRFLVSVPLFHVGGMQTSTLPALALGAQVTLVPHWRAEDWIKAAAAFRPTIFALVPAMIVDLIHWAQTHPESKPDLSQVRMGLMGGSPTWPAVVSQFHALFGVSLRELYGQTELTGLSVTYRDHEPWRQRSMGRPQSQVLDAAIYESDDIIYPLKPTVTGELLFRGETVSPGYWHQPEQTRQKWIDGWFRTGDIVSVDEDEYLYYRDRVDDMIISGGENIYPAEVEAHLTQLPPIQEVAVIGTPHPRWGEQVTAVIVLKGEETNKEDLRRQIDSLDALASYKRPRRIEFVPSLPRTGSGKVNKALLKQQYHTI